MNTKKVLAWLTGGLLFAGSICMAANEISIRTALTAARDFLNLSYDTGSLAANMGATAASDATYIITTATTQKLVIASSVTTNGWCWMRNVTTNAAFYALVGPTNDGAGLCIKLMAGEPAMFRLTPGNDLYSTSVGGTVSLRMVVLQQ